MSKCENGTASIRCGGVGDFWIDTLMGEMTLCWKCYQESESHNMPLIREQIAKEIVGELLDHPPMNDIDSIVIQVIKDCADIARGEVRE
jgi:hypothetical protein